MSIERLAARCCAWRKRRPDFHGEFSRGSCRGGERPERDPDRGFRGLGCRRDGHGRRRIRSVSSQADSEAADLARERNALNEEPEAELTELEKIYVARGLEPVLARQVAEQLTAKDALSAHERDELGFSDNSAANPLQAAAASALAFSVGAALPTLVAVLAPQEALIAAVSIATLIFLVALGGLGWLVGGATGVAVFRPRGSDFLGRDGDGRNGGDRRGCWEGGLVGFRSSRKAPRGLCFPFLCGHSARKRTAA